MAQVIVGSVGRPFGVVGDLYVKPLTDSVDIRFAVNATMTADTVPIREVTVQSARLHSGRLVVHFVGVDDRDAAKDLTGATLRVEVSADEQPNEPEAYFDHQLVGLAVLSCDADELGVVIRVDHLPADDYLIVQTTDDQEVMVPFRTEFVPEVAVAAGHVVVDARPGLFSEVDDED
jgi:16S rRNA processing protein RimM